MKQKNLKWKEIQNIEDSFYGNIKESLTSAVTSIMECEIDTVGLTPTTFYFHAADEAHCADWSVSEDALKIKNICKIGLDEADVNKKWDETADQLVEAIIEDDSPMNIWEDLLDICAAKMTPKQKLRGTKRVAVAESKAVASEKTHKTKSKTKIADILKESVAKVSKLVDDFFGNEQETEYTFDISEGKLVKENVPVKPIMRNVEEARQSAKQLDFNEYLKNKIKFLEVNEEAYFLTESEIKTKLEGIAAYSFDLDEKDVATETTALLEHRTLHEDTIRNIFSPFVNTDNKPIDTIIMEAEQLFETDKKNFMEELVEILKEIFETVAEEAEDGATKEKANRFRSKLEDEIHSEEGVDKDVLAELAKSAVELASTLEGIEDTSSIDQDELMNKPGVDTESQTSTPALKQPFQEDVEDDLMGTMDDLENPDGDEFDLDGEEEEGEEWKELHCIACNSDFKVDMNRVRAMNELPAGEDGVLDNNDALADVVDGTDEPSTLDVADASVETEAECDDVRCPYCHELVSTCGDEDDDMIDQALDGLDLDGEEDEDELEEAGPACDQPAQEVTGNVNYSVKGKKKLSEQSPAADYEYIIKANKNSMVNPTSGKGGTPGGFKQLDNTSNKSDDDFIDGETVHDKSGKGFKNLDNSSPKSDDSFIDGETIHDKSGKPFTKGGNSNTKADDKGEGDQLKAKGGKFKKADNKSPKSDDKFIDGDTIHDKKGKPFTKGGAVTPKSDDKFIDGEELGKSGKGFKKLDNKSKPEKLKESTVRKPRRRVKRKK